DRDDLVPFVFGHFGHGLVDRDAGVVDQDVEAAVEVDDLLDGSLTVSPAPDIALMNADLGAVTGGRQLGEELLCLFGVPAVPRGYRCALTGQALADRCTDTPGTTGHERNTAVELALAVHSLGLADLFDRCRHDDPSPYWRAKRDYGRQESART